MSQARNLPGWEGRSRWPRAAERCGAPVAIGNDVQVATDAEFELGAASEFRSLLGVFWGTGVGGGIVLDGKPWVGRGAAGEIGHVVVKIGGARCPCGRRGCMEAYAGRGRWRRGRASSSTRASKTVLFEIMEERGRDAADERHLDARARARRRPGARAVDRAVERSAPASPRRQLLDVEAVVIGGGLGLKFGEPYADRLASAMLPHLFAYDARRLPAGGARRPRRRDRRRAALAQARLGTSRVRGRAAVRARQQADALT